MKPQSVFLIVFLLTGCASNKEFIEQERKKLQIKAYRQANFTCEFEMKIKPDTPEFERCGEQAYQLAYQKVYDDYKREVLMESANYNASRPRTCSPNGLGGVTCY